MRSTSLALFRPISPSWAADHVDRTSLAARAFERSPSTWNTHSLRFPSRTPNAVGTSEAVYILTERPDRRNTARTDGVMYMRPAESTIRAAISTGSSWSGIHVVSHWTAYGARVAVPMW